VSRLLVENWIAAVCTMDDILVACAIDALQDAEADQPGPHWRILEHDAYQRCLENGGSWSVDVRASLLHAAFAQTPFHTDPGTNGIA